MKSLKINSVCCILLVVILVIVIVYYINKSKEGLYTQPTCATAWNKCGGIGWTGATCCEKDYHCYKSSKWWHQCIPETLTKSQKTEERKAARKAARKAERKVERKAKEERKREEEEERKAEAEEERKRDEEEEIRFPEHWGKPPTRTTRDVVSFPGGYGYGSSTVKEWIAGKMAADKDALTAEEERVGLWNAGMRPQDRQLIQDYIDKNGHPFFDEQGNRRPKKPMTFYEQVMAAWKKM
jgi:hypothetical protein